MAYGVNAGAGRKRGFAATGYVVGTLEHPVDDAAVMAGVAV
jgi:hypothetical protein